MVHNLSCSIIQNLFKNIFPPKINLKCGKLQCSLQFQLKNYHVYVNKNTYINALHKSFSSEIKKQAVRNNAFYFTKLIQGYHL